MRQISLFVVIVGVLFAGVHGGSIPTGTDTADPPPDAKEVKEKVEKKKGELKNAEEQGDLEQVISELKALNLKDLFKDVQHVLDEFFVAEEGEHVPEHCGTFVDEVYRVIEAEEEADEVTLKKLLIGDLRCIGRGIERIDIGISELIKEEPAEAPAKRDEDEDEDGDEHGEEYILTLLFDLYSLMYSAEGIKHAVDDYEEYKRPKGPSDKGPSGNGPSGNGPSGNGPSAKRTLTALLEELLNKRAPNSKHSLKRSFDALRDFRANRRH